MAEERMVPQADCSRTAESPQRAGDDCVPLAVAATVALNQLRGEMVSGLSREAHDDALNLIAAGLSRLMPIYIQVGEDPLVVSINLAVQRFTGGAAELQAADGTSIKDLRVRREDLHAALPLIRQAGLPLEW